MRALLVSYVFPPVGGAGVGRTLKLAKYLPDHGVEPAVMTCANPSVPVFDESLLRDVRPEMEIVRARTLEPGYALKKATWERDEASGDGKGSGGKGRAVRGVSRRLVGLAGGLARAALVPDPQILWQPHAQVVLGQRLAGSRRDDVVFISGPPFSQFLLAPLARARRGTAVVLDYRDEWVTYRNTYEMMGRASAVVGAALERTLVRAAHAITTATEAFRERLLGDFPFLDPARVHAIPNGYDPDDFPARDQLPAPPSDRFVLTYAGTVFKLTSPRGLIGALGRLRREDPALARLLEVRFVGRIVDTELPLFAGSEELGVVQRGYVGKDEVVRELAASHMVLCLLDEVAGTERIYPAKIFELMYLGRPCLTLAPPGALADLCHRHRLGAVIAPRDEAAIASHLAEVLRRFRDGEYRAEADAVDVERYHRRAQAGQFAAVFEQAVEAARG
ncbi:MAG TPA: glycosyltransferase [Kofleriaceae bacterium]|nr:glycosyltransferase [Kofleriaceae bacterium]